MSQTNYLQIVISGLQRTAGPYRSAISNGAISRPTPRDLIAWPMATAWRLRETFGDCHYMALSGRAREFGPRFTTHVEHGIP